MTLTSVEVRSGDDGRLLLRLTGEDLANVTEGAVLPSARVSGCSVPVSGSVTIVVDVAVPANEVPAT